MVEVWQECFFSNGKTRTWNALNQPLSSTGTWLQPSIERICFHLSFRPFVWPSSFWKIRSLMRRSAAVIWDSSRPRTRLRSRPGTRPVPPAGGLPLLSGGSYLQSAHVWLLPRRPQTERPLRTRVCERRFGAAGNFTSSCEPPGLAWGCRSALENTFNTPLPQLAALSFTFLGRTSAAIFPCNTKGSNLLSDTTGSTF